MDFKIAFNDNDGLILNWDNRFDTLVNFLSSDGHIKDTKIKRIVENVRNTPDLAENGKNAAIFWALHGYFVPTKLVVTKKDERKTNTKYTIKDSQESFLFIGKTQQEVEDHLLHLKDRNISIQPFLCCVGED
ncbi:uncharacterized protein LOC126885178 [Diabrotica virgifera virgifera]|uniref:Uncharacterized protein n=1 Tax=Diabrotica virgifera virgifera TaxID=50390 RepID=A0ABM5KBJ7_DIAVI|nr:uncharacterized protein LOC126885178 [Diabrotica virgifera virgifera]